MARTITVYDASSQRRVVIENVEATTFGDLKPILRDNGFDVTDKDIREGISRVTIVDDATILPSNIPYRGGVTNDLLIYMTLKNKKISSGMDRQEAIKFIKDNNLGEEVKSVCGDNYTRVSTVNLIKFVENKTANVSTQTSVSTPKEDKESCDCKHLENALRCLVNYLKDEDCLGWEEADDVLSRLEAGCSCSSDADIDTPKDNGVSMDEISSLIRGL